MGDFPVIMPAVDVSSIGAGGSNVVPNTGRIFMRLTPRETRPSADEIVQDLRKKLAAAPGRQGMTEYGTAQTIDLTNAFGGCPTRIVIRTGYGDVAGLIALVGVAGGVVAATLSMRWYARR